MFDPQELYKRFEQAKTNRDNWDNLYEEALNYFRPQRNTYYEPTKGEKRTRSDIIFDSTAQNALADFTSNAQADMFPQSKRWFRLKTGVFLQNHPQREELDKNLETITELVASIIRASNLDTQITPFLEDWSIGTASMLIHKGTLNDPVRFEAIPLDQVYLELGKCGSIDGRFRRWKIQNRLIKPTWEDAKLTSQLESAVKESPYDERYIIEYTIPDRVKVKSLVQNKKDKTKLVDEFVDGFRYFIQDESSKEIIVTRTGKSHPWINVRYTVSAGEVYGRGNALVALADVKSLNKAKELDLKNAALAVSGIYLVTEDNLINLENIQFKPGTMIPVTSNNNSSGSGAAIQPLPIGTDFRITQIVVDNLIKSIKSIMMVEPMGEVDGAVKTATEIANRLQLMAKKMGSPFGRMQREGAEQIIKRILHILEEFGIVNLTPYKVDGTNIDIQYDSPLAVTQDQDDLRNLTRYAELVSGFFGEQGLLTMLNPEAFGKELARLLGIKSDILPTQEQMEAIKQTMQQSQQEEVQQ